MLGKKLECVSLYEVFDKTWNFVTIIPLVIGYGGLEDLSIFSISTHITEGRVFYNGLCKIGRTSLVV